MPNLQLCVSLAKMMTECHEYNPQFLSDVMDLTSSLLHDDDENIELWYAYDI